MRGASTWVSVRKLKQMVAMHDVYQNPPPECNRNDQGRQNPEPRILKNDEYRWEYQVEMLLH